MRQSDVQSEKSDGRQSEKSELIKWITPSAMREAVASPSAMPTRPQEPN